MPPSPTTDKLAVLIDADNAQASLIQKLLDEISSYGTATVKRAYGDWTTPNLRSWKEVLHTQAIQPIQQFSYSTGKNSTDSTMIIDAMDLLHAERVQGFCLISSDSDFTRLATRIRESGLTVYGFGEKKTPKAFVAACDKFVFTEILSPEPGVPQGDTSKLEALLRQAVATAARDNGWADLSPVGGLILKSDPSFDSRNYGYPKLGDLVRKQSYLEVREESTSATSANTRLFVRLRDFRKQNS